jgi:hypothetical protein
MRQLNVIDRKLNIIEQLIILNDDKVFTQVENIINESLQRPKLKRFSKSDLIKRAKASNLDIERGDVFSQDDVEKLSQNW